MRPNARSSAYQRAKRKKRRKKKSGGDAGGWFVGILEVIGTIFSVITCSS